MGTRRHDFDLDAYARETRERTCFICDIVAGRDGDGHQILHRDDTAIAFFNRYPTMLGYCLVAPIDHREAVLDDFTEAEYLLLQGVVRKVGRAVSSVVPTERVYVLSLGSNQGNAHVHWHVAPLPPGIAYEDQQFHALMIETAGYLDVSTTELDELAAAIRAELQAP
jgi:diadenosine tetraphosphate (Ap4A) HIT family hydrolase